MTEDTLRIARERVHFGTSYLDAEFPGWEAYIDRAELDMADGWRCLLGSLVAKMPAFAEMPDGCYSPYLSAVRWLASGDTWEERGTWAYLRGFTDAVDADVDTGVTYDDLQFAWIEELERRQAQYAVRPGSTPEPAPMTPAEDEAFRDEYESRGIFGDE